MSGTSRDGMDAALIETDGEDRVVCKQSLTLPYDESFRRELARLCAYQKFKDEEFKSEMSLLATRLGEELADIAYRAVAELMGGEEGMSRLGVVGFHGHTIFHAPAQKKTLQIGDGARLARRCGRRVVCNFRQKDMEHGGQGAPLAPLYHRAVARQLRVGGGFLSEHPLVFVNIGGVANVTWIAPPKKKDEKDKGGKDEGGKDKRGEERMLAFDTGAGNALLDDWVARRTRQAFDKDGELASKGRVCAQTLRRLLSDPFFAVPPPKSLDRDRFSPAPLQEAALSLEDGAATLTAFLVESLWLARRFFPSKAGLWLLCGGGRKNHAVVEGLKRKMAEENLRGIQSDARPIDALGFDGDALEAQAFAYLAVRRLRGLPSSYPALTGASKATCGGDLCHA